MIRPRIPTFQCGNRTRKIPAKFSLSLTVGHGVALSAYSEPPIVSRVFARRYSPDMSANTGIDFHIFEKTFDETNQEEKWHITVP